MVLKPDSTETSVGCGTVTVEGHGDYRTCGKPWYSESPYICDRCLHKPIADAARSLIVALEEDRSEESDKIRPLKVSQALQVIRSLYFKEKQ